MVIFVVIKFIFLGRTIDVRGYPSEFFSYTPENVRAKFHAFIRSVTIISIRDCTISPKLQHPCCLTMKLIGANYSSMQLSIVN